MPFDKTYDAQLAERKAQEELLENFGKEFYKLYQQAKSSGAIPDGATTTEIGRCVMVIAAENFAPMSPFGKKMLANLRHFI